MKTEIVIEKFQKLPASLQLQVNDYIDFLIVRYSDLAAITNQEEEQEEEFELTDKIKNLLDQRITLHEVNPDKVKPWKEVLTNIAKKYNYEL